MNPINDDQEAAPAAIGRVEPENPWGTFLDVKYAPLERFDIGDLVNANDRPWYNQTLCRVNDCVIRLGVVHGVYPWHRHEEEDEFFFVVEGALSMDLDGLASVQLGVGQGITVPRGARHRPRAVERTIILMVEGAGVVPTGD
jgi:mannose-6-phosphate isomerase-like protein (cupin superfamily)